MKDNAFLEFLLNGAGIFALILGALHFTFPVRFGFMNVLEPEGSPIPPFRLWFYHYQMKRSDLRGIIYVMNHCVSYTIMACGAFGLAASWWLGTIPGSIAAIVVAGFYLLRAISQLYLGKRKGDWLVLAWFLLLGVLHLFAAGTVVVG